MRICFGTSADFSPQFVMTTYADLSHSNVTTPCATAMRQDVIQTKLGDKRRSLSTRHVSSTGDVDKGGHVPSLLPRLVPQCTSLSLGSPMICSNVGFRVSRVCVDLFV